MAVSSCIVFLFTSLLFLSGYVLQQQTVRSLQAAIRPPAPAPLVTQSPVLAKHFGTPPGHSFYDKFLSSNIPKGGWAKAGYVQILRSHVEVCTAVMLFAELERQESMGQRIIFYPKRWDEQRAAQQQKRDRVLETSMRLLRTAASRYRVMLQAIEPAIGADTGSILHVVGASVIRLTSDTANIEAIYPLNGLLSLTTFNRLIYLRPSGLIGDSAQLDLLFTLPSDTSVLGISPTHDEEDKTLPIMIFQPSRTAYNDTIARFPIETYSDSYFMRGVEVMTDFAGDKVHLLAKTSALRSLDESFDNQGFLGQTGYIHFSDPGLPGPEFYLSNEMLASARPTTLSARKAWDKSYEIFREHRIEICGLDLQPLEE